MKSKISSFATLALLLVFFAMPNDALAASACGVSIKVDGKHICGYTITWTKQSDRKLIEQLASNSLTFESGYKLAVDKKDPNKATLSGKITVASKLRGKTGLVAEVKTLNLVKRKGEWYVADADIKSAAKSAKKPATGKKKPKKL